MATKKTKTEVADDISSLLSADIDELLADTSEESESLDDLISQTAEELTEASPEPSEDSLTFLPEETERSERTMPEEAVESATALEINEGQEILFEVVSETLQLGFDTHPKGSILGIIPNKGKWHWTVDKSGKSWIRHLNDPEKQVELWGEVRIAPPTPRDPRLDELEVPDFVPENLREQWRKSVIEALDARS